MDPWLVELIVVRSRSFDDGERRTLARDVERGLLTRVRWGVYVERGAWQQAEPDGRQIIAMRALAAVSEVEPVFSHWSAALLHGLPFIAPRTSTVHTTVPDPALRGVQGVSGHVFAVREEELRRIGGLLVTDLGRTVVDVAGASSFEDGVVVADGALSAGLPRELLEQAFDLAGPRHAATRIAKVVDFAHPGGESANESRSRTTMYRLGVEPPELQHEVWDRRGLAGVVDTWWEEVRAAGEADGAKKYLDPALAPDGAGRVVYDEKKREDRIRAQSKAFTRWGWEESCSSRLLREVLAGIGVRPLARRPTLADWAVIARAARPRRPRLVVPR